MEKENENINSTKEEQISPISQKHLDYFKEIPRNIIIKKLNGGELKIEDILQNDECINELRTNIHSEFKKILTVDNIKILIGYCLNPKLILDKNSQRYLRYPYYSCQILCSHNCLYFSFSIKSIKKLNNIKNINENSIENDIKSKNSSLEKSKEDILPLNKTEEIDFINPINDEDFFDMNPNNNSADIGSFEDYFLEKNEYIKELEDKFIDIYKSPLTDIDQLKGEKTKKTINEYDKEDKDIINNILNEIFNTLDSKNYDDPTYLGYFQKIVNYLLFYEPDIIIDFLLKDSPPIINKLYYHLNSAAIGNIIENILNIISDKEEEFFINNINYIKDSNYIKIIQDLLKELIKEENFEKSENICDLITNTLINNSDKQLIELIFSDKSTMEIIKNYVKKIVNKENNNKILINIIQVLCQLNNVIMSSFEEKSPYNSQIKDLDFFIRENIKFNPLEYQYFRKKFVSKNKIFDAFQNNSIKYLESINEIYHIIKKDIKNKWKSIKKTENKNNINNENNNYNKKNNILGLKSIYEWKYILSSLKVYIISFYLPEMPINGYNHFFFDEKLFKILIKIYLDYPQNSLFQNIFIEIIKLICNERCPKYLIRPFLKVDEKNNQNIFIYEIINNLKKGIENKNNNLLIGTDIDILNSFYSSINKKILKYFNHHELDNIYKNFFIKFIKPKYYRKIGENYELSNSELFDINDDNNKTFDGKEEEEFREIWPINKLINKFVKKCEMEKNNYNNNDDKEMYNKKRVKKNESNNLKDTIQIKYIHDFNNKNKIIEAKEIIEIEKGDNFEMKMETEYLLLEGNEENSEEDKNLIEKIYEKRNNINSNIENNEYNYDLIINYMKIIFEWLIIINKKIKKKSFLII